MRSRTFWVVAIGGCLSACGSDNPSMGGPDGGSDGTTSPEGSTGDGSPGADGSMGDGGSCGVFPSSAIFYQDISKANVDAQWGTIQQVLANGWGNAFQLDPSFTVLEANANVPRRPFTQPQGAMPDCDTAPVPVPPGGNTEGEKDYFCAGGGDCHLIVHQADRLYELYQGSITGGQSTGGTFTGECLVVWDLCRDYWKPGNPYSRGDGCNGADAADVPIAPLLLKKAEIAAHAIDHAMRFTIGNPKIDNTYYVHPATHLGGSGTPMQTIPYGARFRLKSTFNVQSLPNPEARAIAVALQKYGMFMDDGGGFYVSATTDIVDVIDTHDLKTLLPTDFEMVDGGQRINFHQQNCTRTVVTN